MEFPITFSESLSHPDDEDGITLRVVLASGQFSVDAFAKVDTGAAVCLFSHEIGLRLRLDIESGTPIQLGSLSGTLDAFGHEVTMKTGSLTFHTTVYFAKDPGLPRNFLGRQGWLRNIRLGVIDYENLLYLSKYENSIERAAFWRS